MAETKAVLDFLSECKTRKEIEEKFKLSNTESFHLIRWFLKSGAIESFCIKQSGVRNRVWYYKRNPKR